MGKKDKNKKKGFGIEKTTAKTDKKLIAKQKKLLLKIGEVKFSIVNKNFILKLEFNILGRHREDCFIIADVKHR